MGKYRTYEAELKAWVVLEALQGQKTAAQICRENGIADDLLAHWKREFIERAPELFCTRQDRSADEARIAELERLVGQLTLELAAVKNSRSILRIQLCEEMHRDAPAHSASQQPIVHSYDQATSSSSATCSELCESAHALVCGVCYDW